MAALTRWNPLEAMEEFLNEGFKLVPSFSQGRQGRLNMWEEGTQLHLDLEVPGYKADEFNISIEGDKLHIQASHEESCETSCEKGSCKERNYLCKEISCQSFERWIPLPHEVREEAEAQYSDGILSITLNQTSALPVKQIKVKPGTAH